MHTPPPFVVANSGEAEEAPEGAIPINLYGAGTGGGGDSSEFVRVVDLDNPFLHISSYTPDSNFINSVQIGNSGLGITDTTKVGLNSTDLRDPDNLKFLSQLSSVSTLSTGELTLQTAIQAAVYKEDVDLKVGLDIYFGDGPISTSYARLNTPTLEEFWGFEFEDSTIMTAQTLTQAPGYDAGETQVLKHVNGVLQWVTEAE